MKNFFKFVLIGGIATALQFSILTIFVKFFAFNPTASSALAYLCGGIFNYLANYHYTFSSNSPHKSTLPKFSVTVLAGMSLNTASFHVFYNTITTTTFIPQILHSYTYLIAQLFATLVTLFFNFTIHKIWIYRG